MPVEFWLEDMLLPVTPSNYQLDYGNEVETVRATAKGDMNIIGHKKPRTVSVTGFFTVHEYPFAIRQFRAYSAMDYVEQVQEWIDDQEIVRLVIADETSTKINALFYVENIQYSESAQSNGDIDYTIALREYSGKQSKRRRKKSVQSLPRATAKKASATKSYTVKSEDYLIKLARQFYGDASQWEKIYNANKSVIGKNPNMLSVGQVLTIP